MDNQIIAGRYAVPMARPFSGVPGPFGGVSAQPHGLAGPSSPGVGGLARNSRTCRNAVAGTLAIGALAGMAAIGMLHLEFVASGGRHAAVAASMRPPASVVPATIRMKTASATVASPVTNKAGAATAADSHYAPDVKHTFNNARHEVVLAQAHWRPTRPTNGQQGGRHSVAARARTGGDVAQGAALLPSMTLPEAAVSAMPPTSMSAQWEPRTHLRLTGN